jgi:23S rRNA (adenine2503-C2)-methyltransferase
LRALAPAQKCAGVFVSAAACYQPINKEALMSAIPTSQKYEQQINLTPAMPSLVGMTRAQLSEALRQAGAPERDVRMRVSQLWHWIYFQGAKDFDRMLNVSKHLRKALEERFTLARPEVVSEQVSNDGTRKWLFRLPPAPGDLLADKGHGAEIECVYIPESDRGTLCVSSQVGCTLTCTFCHTGTQKLVRNLTSQEIVQQLVTARDQLGDYPGLIPPTDGLIPSGEGVRPVSNIVFMGMGEPLYNFDNVCDAIGVLSDGDGLSLSKRRITVSTSGVAPEIPRLGGQVGTMLAISLHAVRDDLREKLVPLNKKYPIKDLLQACRDYPGLSNARRITFEYVMLKGVNDSPSDARELVRLLKGIPAKINLIPFNPWPGAKYECSDWDVIESFSDIVFNAGYASPVRTPRGRDILAACGQLKSETEKLRARARLIEE